VKHLKRLRQDEINKHGVVVSLIKKTGGFTDDDVTRFLNKLDNGELDENTVRQKSPLPAKSIDKFARITTEIKKQNADMKRLQALRQELAGAAPEARAEMKERMAEEPKPLLEPKPGMAQTEPKPLPLDKPLPAEEPLIAGGVER
jgi:hypothetical protein